MRRGYASLVGSFLLDGSTPQTMFAPNLHRMGKRQSRRFVWTGGFAVSDKTFLRLAQAWRRTISKFVPDANQLRNFGPNLRGGLGDGDPRSGPGSLGENRSRFYRSNDFNNI